MFGVQVQEAKVPPSDRLELIKVARDLAIRLGDLAQDFPQRLHLLAELPHVVLEVAFTHARSPSNPRGLKSPDFPSGFDADQFTPKPRSLLEQTDLDLARVSEEQLHHSSRLERANGGHAP